MLRALVVALLCLTGGWSASAHDSWINRRNLRNSANELCCGPQDCGIMVAGGIIAMTRGYEVDAEFLIEHENGDRIRERVREFVPYSEALPSPDGAFWRCKRPDGTRRCFFAPKPGS